MAKGENIFRRRDGRWEARYSKGRELSGKIKYGYCYGKTYREAKEKAEKCKAALASGNPLPTSRTPNLFSAYCMGWLHAKKSKVKESTYIKYSTVVEKHIIPKLGACCPLGFTTELMDDFIKELQFEDELAPKTVHDIQNAPWKDRAFQLWSASWRFILGRKDDCLFYLRYYYSANCRTYAYEEHLQCFQELFSAVEQTFKPEANVNMLLHQVFDTMLSFAARVLGGEMPDDDATTQWAFEQIYSFVVPNVREELLIPSGSTPA